MAPPGYGIYSVEGTVPEFRMYQKADGAIEQHVRYINKSVKYTGKWMVIPIIKEETNGNTGNTQT
jgi:hypothetical protein